MILSRAVTSGKLKGCADLLFQPAEEGTTGARKVIDAGLFTLIHPDRCFGIHNWPSVPSGKIVIHEGALMAAKRNFSIRIFGSGGHGSMPHLNTDPIVYAAALIQSLQTVVSRNMNPLTPTVLSVNMIHGGSPVNLVVDEVEIRATVRSLSDDALSRAIERIETIVMKSAQAYECRAEIEWKERIPAVINTLEMCELAKRIAEEIRCMAETTDAPPSLASEDFSLYREYVPSFFYWVGSHTQGEQIEQLHRPRFHTDDEALRVTASLYANSALL